MENEVDEVVEEEPSQIDIASEIPVNIEFYTAMPYKTDDDTLDDWFHVAYNNIGEHIEAVWDLETLFRPDAPERFKPLPLMGLTDYFQTIRLHFALDYTSYKYHEPLIQWAVTALVPNGKLKIITRNADYIFKYWLIDILGIESVEDEDSVVSEKSKGLKGFAEKALGQSGIPSHQFEQLSREEINEVVPDRINLDRPALPWEFDLWLNQRLFSSGSGEPQDSFKSICTGGYLSTLLKRGGLIIEQINAVPNNPYQLEAIAKRHASRLFSLGGLSSE